jgi:cell division protein FtsI/penicillin-binding protein 2
MRKPYFASEDQSSLAIRIAPARLRSWTLLLIFVAVAIVCRLLWIQIIRHSYYLQLASHRQVSDLPIPAQRGDIRDRNGLVLVTSIPQKAVFLDPVRYQKVIAQEAQPKPVSHHEKHNAKQPAKPQLTPAEKFARLTQLLQMTPADIHAKLLLPGKHVEIKSVSRRVGDQIRELKLSWVGLEDENKRTYPYGAMAAQTLGFIGADGHGLAGLEIKFNRYLAGRDGAVTQEMDGRRPRRPIPGMRHKIPPVDGHDLRLTIDASLQQVAESALAQGIENAGAAGGTALVMDPINGEILALACQPAFNPNDYQSSPQERWQNPAIVGVYEPGSTFKLVMATGALEAGFSESMQHAYCSGSKAIGRRTIHCAHNPHGQVDLERIIEQSCNIGAATIGMRLGRERLAHYVKALGFGQRTGIELQGETPGLVPNPKHWSDIQLANIAFGQGISVTPIQLLRSYCIIANGGIMIQPHLVFDPAKHARTGPRVISEATAAKMRRLFVTVVENGTGKAAAVKDFQIGGKTGTAQKPIPGIGYRSGKYIGSFIGFLPADRPRVAILVLIDEPTRGHYGGVVAAPVFQQIACQALLRYEIPPHAPVVSTSKLQPHG